jgi:hypothetical protein
MSKLGSRISRVIGAKRKEGGMERDLTGSSADMIRHLEAERYQAMLKADTSTLAALLSDQAIYTHSDGSQDSKAEYLQKVTLGIYRYRSIEHGLAGIVSLGTFLVHGWMKANVDVHGVTGQLDNISLAVWSFVDSRWQLAGYASTPIARRQ